MLGEEDREQGSNRIYKSIEVIFDLRQDHGVLFQSCQVAFVLKMSRILAVQRQTHQCRGKWCSKLHASILVGLYANRASPPLNSTRRVSGRT